MVFCCIAIVAIAIIYFTCLWIRQVFSRPRRDPHHPSRLKPPPRALSGNGALPVWGHTRLFQRHAGDVALLFHKEWMEIPVVPKSWTRSLGDCFAIFIWGQWRIAIKGPDSADKFFTKRCLKEDWPWNPPVTLLGKTCLAFLQDSDPEQAQELRRIIRGPLAHEALLAFAPLFAVAAENCLSILKDGKYSSRRGSEAAMENQTRAPTPTGISPSSSHTGSLDFSVRQGSDDLTASLSGEGTLKIKWEALRSYTFDLIDGPLFNMNQPLNATFTKLSTATLSSRHSNGHSSDEDAELNTTPSRAETPKLAQGRPRKHPSRERMLLWMERMKVGLDVIKITFGPRWMYMWLFNEYGRALNARTSIAEHISKHVKEMTRLVPVAHKLGHAYQDPTTQPFPLLTLGRNLVHNREGIFGDTDRLDCCGDSHQRRRAFTESDVKTEFFSDDDSTTCSATPSPPSPSRAKSLKHNYVTPFEMEQDLARPKYFNSVIWRMPTGKDSVPGHDNLSNSVSTQELFDQKISSKVHKSTFIEGAPSDFRRMQCTETPLCQPHLASLDRQPSKNIYCPSKDLVPGNSSHELLSEAALSLNRQHLVVVQQCLSLTCASTRSDSVGRCIECQCHASDVVHSGTVFPLPLSLNSPPLDDPGTTSCRKIQIDHLTSDRTEQRSVNLSHFHNNKKAGMSSLLERLLRQKGPDDTGVSQTTITELCINLWMMLDVGNAWTAMAFHLLSSDRKACHLVQEELDKLRRQHSNDLFSPVALEKMRYLDALLYESIRLTPPFLGGLKSTTETVELEEVGVQVPKGSHIFFCQPSDTKFDIHAALDKRPELLGEQYPCVDLYGFLPLQGLEVPLMVLQSKIFLIVALQKFSPYVSKRRTFVRRVKSAVNELSSCHASKPTNRFEGPSFTESVVNTPQEELPVDPIISLDSEEGSTNSGQMTPSVAMSLFTKIPFPEPRRIIRLRPRCIISANQ